MYILYTVYIYSCYQINPYFSPTDIIGCHSQLHHSHTFLSKEWLAKDGGAIRYYFTVQALLGWWCNLLVWSMSLQMHEYNY